VTPRRIPGVQSDTRTVAAGGWHAPPTPFKKAGGDITNSKPRTSGRKSVRLDHRLQVGLALDFPLLVRWANREEGTGRWAKKVRGKLKLIDAAEAQLKAMILLASTGGCRGASG